MKLDLIKNITRKSLVFCALVLFGVGVTYSQGSQVRASQRAGVSQTVAKNQITIEYSRPSAKGRVLFGPEGIIKFDEIWMPGADEASNIRFNEDLFINGKLLKAGRYSFWFIPNEKEWTVIFSKDWDQWHTRYPGKDEDALRLKIEPREGEHMELMSFYFPAVAANSATINFHWGKTIIPLKLKLTT